MPASTTTALASFTESERREDSVTRIGVEIGHLALGTGLGMPPIVAHTFSYQPDRTCATSTDAREPRPERRPERRGQGAANLHSPDLHLMVWSLRRMKRGFHIYA